jgi:hypothetical protein
MRRRAESPGEAIEGAFTAAHDVCGALDEAGFLPFGDILTSVLDGASSIARAVGGRARRGEAPSPTETRLPGPLAAIAATSAMRPGAPGYYGPPGYAPGFAPPGFAPPGYGYAPAAYSATPPGWPKPPPAGWPS